MNYQQLIIVGNATEDARRRTSQKGDVVYSTFTVGVSDSGKQSTYFPVVVFGRQVEAVIEYVTKGRQVLVVGRIQVFDNGHFNLVADRVQFGYEPAAGKGAAENAPPKAGADSA